MGRTSRKRHTYNAFFIGVFAGVYDALRRDVSSDRRSKPIKILEKFNDYGGGSLSCPIRATWNKTEKCAFSQNVNFARWRNPRAARRYCDAIISNLQVRQAIEMKTPSVPHKKSSKTLENIRFSHCWPHEGHEAFSVNCHNFAGRRRAARFCWGLQICQPV